MNLVLRVLLVSLALAVPAFAVDGVPTFRAGLQAFQANGTDALLNAWYDGDEEREKVAELKRRLQAMTRDLGPVIDTEVFAPRNLGRHVQRLYGVIYFRKRPLWLRAEYYGIQGRAGFISLEFSPLADDILPLEIGTASR